MATPRDRLRLILAAGEAPPPPPSSAVRARLALLGAERAPPGTVPLAPQGAWQGPSLLALVGGEERSTPHGPMLCVERRHPLSGRRGGRALAEALGRAVLLRAPERGPGGAAALDPSEAVFLDTETTGLAGGTGTVAFLVGTGWVAGDDFVVRQYCMRDYPEEAALLHALLEDLGERPLVTFNGRAFDWPLLLTRFHLHRRRPLPRAHLDLLPAVRRLWPESLASHGLTALERDLLCHQREDDLPSHRIPEAYFTYLRSGCPDEVARAFDHNEDDVVSMLALMGCVGRALEAPHDRAEASVRDLLSTARFLEELGRPAEALRCLEAATEREDPLHSGLALAALGHAWRRAGRWQPALDAFERAARTSPAFEPEAYEQVAKIREHRQHDWRGALTWVEAALARIEPGSRWEAAFRHREARLCRRLQAAEEAAPAPRGPSRSEVASGPS